MPSAGIELLWTSCSRVSETVKQGLLVCPRDFAL
jgi:hypothetical protein